MARPLLDISTLIDRRTVRIDGVEHELRNPGELSVFENQRISKWGVVIDRVIQADDPTDAELKQAETMLDSLCRLVLLAPDDVQKKLADTQRIYIAQAFTKLQQAEKSPTATSEPEETPATESATAPAETTTSIGEK